MKFDIERELERLVTKCRKENIKLTGAVELDTQNQSKLIGFASIGDNEPSSEAFNNISTLINNRGDMDSFLMELSDQCFGESQQEDESIIYTRTNPQIFTTKH